MSHIPVRIMSICRNKDCKKKYMYDLAEPKKTVNGISNAYKIEYCSEECWREGWIKTGVGFHHPEHTHSLVTNPKNHQCPRIIHELVRCLEGKKPVKIHVR